MKVGIVPDPFPIYIFAKKGVCFRSTLLTRTNLPNYPYQISYTRSRYILANMDFVYSW